MRKSRKLKKGDILPFPVGRDSIDASHPCKKDCCMVTVAFREMLIAVYGPGNYYVESTTAGVKFTLDGYRYTGAFPPATSKRIFNFDRTFKETKDEDQARSSIKAFNSEVMIQSVRKSVYSRTPEQRQRHNEQSRKDYHERKAKGFKRKQYEGGRQLSI